MGDAPVSGPTPHKEDEGLRQRLQVSALCDEALCPEGRRGVHGEVDGQRLSPARHSDKQADLRVVTGEGGAPELEASRHEGVCTGPDGTLLQLLGVGAEVGGAVSGVPALESLQEAFGARLQHDVELRHRHAKSLRGHRVSTNEAADLALGDDRHNSRMHQPLDGLHKLVALWRLHDHRDELVDLTLHGKRLKLQGRMLDCEARSLIPQLLR
mmetsp:Transcript_29617/g.64410  ORF Transcript_29617/g.64410 Transcript_29617/m.64410 type:complete len:212 (+) Transcript_29617:638-1273(+)